MTHDSAPQTQPLRYRDLRLRLDDYDSAQGAFRVWVEGEAPGGAMRHSDAVPRVLDRHAFWEDADLYQGGLLGRVDFAALEKDDLETLGRLLADLALPEGPVRQLFDKSLAVAASQGQGLRVRLMIEAPELAQLPWEYMLLPQASGEAQPSDFLALRREVSIARTETVEAAPRALPARRPRIVGLLSLPMDQPKLDVAKDRRALEAAVEEVNEAAGQELITLCWVGRPASRMALDEALQGGADVFQFSGHADFELGGEGYILLETRNRRGERCNAGDLALALRNAGVRLVVLSTCNAGRRNGQVLWSGVAPALTREQVPAVVGNQFDILDESAKLLAARLYPLLLRGCAIDEALSAARRAIYAQGSADPATNRDWGVPVLYLRDSDGVLFPRPEQPPQDVAAAPFLEVAGEIDRLLGDFLGVEVQQVTGGTIYIHPRVKEVGPGGKLRGAKIGKFGS